MKTVNVPASQKYNVVIGNVLGNTGKFLRERFGDIRYAVICDENVKKLHGEALAKAFAEVEYEEYILPAGEKSKSFDAVESLLDFVTSNSFTRRDAVVAVGGGVTGDVAGFAASVYLRGVRVVQMPTTLLSMADSSVGGKTAINTSAGKNLCGTFHQPSLVLCHTPFLRTLPKNVYADGMAEVIKYGVIRDRNLFRDVYRGMDETEMICRCVEIKRDVVAADERETGERIILNFGHTAAHAIERISDYKITHGTAVSMGMVIAASCAEKLGMCSEGTADLIRAALRKYSLKTSCPYTAEELACACSNDKKTDGDILKLVLPVKIGECTVRRISKNAVVSFFEAGLVK